LKKTILLLVVAFVFTLTVPLVALDVTVCLSPNGGFAPINNQRKITVAGVEQPLGLNNSLHDEVLKVPASGAVKICMYNFAHKEIFRVLLDRAVQEGLMVRVLLDNCADWTTDAVKEFTTTVDKVARHAAEEKKPFDFQVKLVTPAVMDRTKRTRVLSDGKKIIGTMHQKFGIIYHDRNASPTTSFGGSANTAPTSDHTYAENRLFFRNSPEVAAVWAAQFARLWNEYADPGTTNCTPEPEIVITKKPDFDILFNVEKLASGSFVAIDDRVMKMLDEVEPEGSVDIAMFSFTHTGIGNKILAMAEKYPNAKFRLLFDHSMLLSGEDRKGLMPPIIEQKVKEKGMKNVEVRYKFRANAYAYLSKEKKVGHDHFRAPLLHHKFMIVNKKKIITGSYNWSGSAELRNMEDAVILTSDLPYGKDAIDRFLAEFDILWNSRYEDREAKPEAKPYTVSREYAMEYEKKILETLGNFACSKIQRVLDDGALPVSNVRNLAKLNQGELNKALEMMQAVRMIEKFEKDGVERWRLAD